jgi:hypothetical protein
METPKPKTPAAKPIPDALAKSAKIELTESDLDKVTGGGEFLVLSGIKGESADAKHKDEIHIESYRP